MNVKKLLAMLLTLVMVLGALTPAAFADDVTNVAMVRGTGYATLPAAIAAAQAGDTVTLLRDLTLTSADVPNGEDHFFAVNKGITIDGDGHTITATYENAYQNSVWYLFEFLDGENNALNWGLQDLTINSTGIQAAVMVNSDSASTLTASGLTITTNGECIYANGPATANLTGCTLAHSGAYRPDRTTGIDRTYFSAVMVGYSGKVNLTNCTVTSTDNGIATFPTGSTITLNNTSVTVSGTAHVENPVALWAAVTSGYTHALAVSSEIIVNEGCKIKGDLRSTCTDENKTAKLTLNRGLFDRDPSAISVSDANASISVAPGYTVYADDSVAGYTHKIDMDLTGNTTADGVARVQVTDTTEVISAQVKGKSTTAVTTDDKFVSVSFSENNEAISAISATLQRTVETVTEDDTTTTTTQDKELYLVVDGTENTEVAAANTTTVVATYDINLWKKTTTTVSTQVGNSSPTQNITETTEPVDYTGGAATVKLPFENYNPNRSYDVYYNDGNGNLTNMNATYANGFFTFSTTHFSTYEIHQGAVTAENIATAFALTLRPTGDATVYDLVLSAREEGKVINRFTSANMKFSLTKNAETGTGHIVYLIDKAEGSNVDVIDGGNGFYSFTLSGTVTPSISAENILLGKVVFGGYGENWTFNVVSDSNCFINTSSLVNNANVVTAAGAGLTVNTETATSAETPTAKIALTILSQKQDLTLNVVFPNSVNNQVKAYQDMKVTISGSDLLSDIVIPLGSDSTSVSIAGSIMDGIGTCTVAFDDNAAVNSFTGQNAYTVTLDNALTKNMRYTVRVSGAGYRTARYSVYLDAATNDGKTLTFWNNVMDSDTVIETGKDSSAATVTYLAGDIVEDYQINIYDLSAAVSYFGTTVDDVTAASNYAKYDLNRDGRIDSIDFAYILISWGK